MCDRFPELSETFIVQEALSLQRLGWSVHIEAIERARTPNDAAAEALRAHYLVEDDRRARLRALAWLAVRHPLGCVRDLARRRRWRRDERVLPLRRIAPVARRVEAAGCVHVHAHFAAEAALTAMRVRGLLGLPYSVTAHAYDIYLEPRNLREKLERAAFATSGCDYTVRDLRAIAAGPAAQRIHEVIMGIDPGLRRGTPHPDGQHVVSVGRLVEKKGFADLIEAAALLRDNGVLERVTIVGDGPLRSELEAAIVAHGVGDVVALAGARQPAEVLRLVEAADVFCLPCVVARDGDRDSMPVVVKEALALEVPVVVTDEVGLPELVRPGWGELVPPHDPPALAGALRRMLERSADERAAMGRAGREFVLAHCDVREETRKLEALILRA